MKNIFVKKSFFKDQLRFIHKKDNFKFISNKKVEY